MNKYLIYAPDYIGNSAGISCMFMLCDILRKFGHEAYMTGCRKTNLSIDAPIIPESALQYIDTTDWVVLYAETVKGNPLGIRRVARWVLNKPGLLGGDEVFADNEFIFYYSDIYKEYIQNEIAGKLHMFCVDEGIFYNRGSYKRDVECFYTGKFGFRDGFIDPKGKVAITRWSPEKFELGDLFRRSKVLYTFDNYTALIAEALMCGCPVVLIPEEEWKYEDIIKLECETYGVFWGLKNWPGSFYVEPVRIDGNNVRLKIEFVEQLENFVTLTS